MSATNPSVVQKQLEKLIEKGLVFSDCIAAFGVNATTTPVVQQARDIYASDDVNIDTETVLSEGNDGTWVLAWVFVPTDSGDEDEDA